MLKTWKSFRNKTGILTPIEFNNIPFTPKRSFIVQNVPAGDIRGRHAHFTTKQLITCLRGEIVVGLHDGQTLTQTKLRQNDFIFIDNLIWDYQIYLTGDDILWSLCSTPHDEKDYIKDFNLFLEVIKNKQIFL